MTGHRLLAAAAIAAAASLASISSASAGCYGCGSSYGYAAPVAYYSAPVVYSYSYAAPAVYSHSYAAPSCGCATAAPMYVVNQGPAYTAPVTIEAEPTPAYEYRHRRAYPYYSDGGVRWHRRHWHRGYGHRYGAIGPRLRYGAIGPRYGYRHHGYRDAVPPRYRHGAVVPGHRIGMRHHGMHHGMHRGVHREMHRGMHRQMHRMHGPRHSMGPRHHGGMRPGVVHPPRHMGPGPQRNMP